jgi:hypothetical protein
MAGPYEKMSNLSILDLSRFLRPRLTGGNGDMVVDVAGFAGK